MGLFSKKPLGGGIMDMIRCDEPSYLIWKWHPEGTLEGQTRKENAIRWGSSLRVKTGSVAAFVYDSGAGIDFIEGPYDGILETKNLPVIASIIGLAYQGGTPFQAEVYFINLAQIIQTKFAVPYFDIYDPRFSDYGIPTAVRGSFNFRITDYKAFVALHRLETFTMIDFQNQVRDAVVRYVESTVANIPEEYGIPVVQLERKLDQINNLVEANIKARFFNEFGVTVTSVDIAVIDVDKTSEGYQQLKAVTQDLTTAAMKAKTEVDIKQMRDTQRLRAIEQAGRIIIGIKEDQYARHKQTQTDHLTAYQIEASERVGVAGAIGLGKTGSAGTGSFSGGLNPGTMMAGMAIGSAVGQNIAGTMTTMMNGINQPVMSPPPIPVISYNVAINGSATGPYDIQTLSKMVDAGQVKSDSLVWRKGMPEWVKASDVEDLKNLFTDPEMPPIPHG